MKIPDKQHDYPLVVLGALLLIIGVVSSTFSSLMSSNLIKQKDEKIQQLEQEIELLKNPPKESESL